MSADLPKKLGKEPLVDAIFEIRFTSSAPASDILPGFLFGKLLGKKSIERLPVADVPQPIRDNDANLKFAPLVRLHWDNFIILIGDRSVAVACKMPYPGWDNFRKVIISTVELINEASIIDLVSRCSVKYVDLIPSKDLKEQISLISLEVMLGGHKLEREAFQLRMEIPHNGFVNVVQIVSSAILTLPVGEEKTGIVVDIDTIDNFHSDEVFDQFLVGLADRVENLHNTSKEMFFNCLKRDTIDFLEPIYE